MEAPPISSRIVHPLTSRQVYSDMEPATQDSAAPRCHRCRILLSASRCPNPACEEVHGAQAGRLCLWCHATMQAQDHKPEDGVSGIPRHFRAIAAGTGGVC